MTIFINGRFLTQKTSGVQRFAREIVSALDRVLAGQHSQEDWVLLTPEGAANDFHLSNIRRETVGGSTGHVWEQTRLYGASRKGKLVNLCNSGPVLHARSLTVIHDAMIFQTPENFSKTYRAVHTSLGHILSRRSKIATVSEFSKRELRETIGAKDAVVLYNSCEHLASVQPDEAILGRFSLQAGKYLLFVGSPTPNKNIARAIDAIRLMGSEAPRFVVVGAAASSVFKGQDDGKGKDDAVIFTGRLSDEEIVALYANAGGLLFPSLYEGFGIPPLEAMSLGCPVLSSDIPPTREVCADAALYFNPLEPEDMVRAIGELFGASSRRSELVEKGHGRAQGYSWQKSAEILRGAVDKL